VATRRKTMRIALVSLLLLAAGGGCGDNSERLSKTEYTRQADGICARYDERLEAIERELERAASPEDAAKAIDRGIPIVQNGVEELRELEPPEELEEDVERWIDLNEENVESLEELRDAAAEGDAQRVREIATEGEETERRSDELARKIGLEDCAADE
jgi:hypothetical protein